MLSPGIHETSSTLRRPDACLCAAELLNRRLGCASHCSYHHDDSCDSPCDLSSALLRAAMRPQKQVSLRGSKRSCHYDVLRHYKVVLLPTSRISIYGSTRPVTENNGFLKLSLVSLIVQGRGKLYAAEARPVEDAVLRMQSSWCYLIRLVNS